MIKTVFLDVDNTVLDFNKSADMAIEMSFSAHGLPYDKNVFPVFKKINDLLWSGIEKNAISRNTLHAVRFNMIFKELGIEGDGQKVEKSFLDALNVCTVPVDGAMDLIKYLSEKYILCSASNAPYIQQIKRLAHSGIDKYLHRIFVSESLGYAKPDPRFFEECFKSLNSPKKSETVMIGDSLSADIAGGINFGIRTIWFNPNGVSAGDIFPDDTVYKLSDIKNIL